MSEENLLVPGDLVLVIGATGFIGILILINFKLT